MKTLKRNHITIYYAKPLGMTDTTDDYGNDTGEPELSYSAPIRYKRFSFGARQGVITLEPFGLSDGYLQPLVTDDMDCPITEATRIWIGKCPCKGDGTDYTHVVEAVIPSINVVKVLCRAVSVS